MKNFSKTRLFAIAVLLATALGIVLHPHGKPVTGVRYGATGDNSGLIKASSSGLDFNFHKGINLTNGSSAQDVAAFGQIPLAATATPAALGTAAVGSGTTWAKADHVHAMPRLDQVGAPTGAVSLNSQLLSSVADPVSAQDAVTKAYLDSRGVTVVAQTTTSLPAYTYANGTAGVGATITANANGAFPTLDGYVTVNAGDAFYHVNGPSAVENGVYTLTSAGSGGSAWVATRHTALDQAAELPGSKIRVKFGLQHGGDELEYRAIATPVMGTTNLYWWPIVSGVRSANTFYAFNEDFQWGSFNNATGALLNPNGFAFAGGGTGATCTSGGTTTRVGILSCSTGTTTTGNGILLTSGGSILAPTATAGFHLDVKIGVPTLSDGTNTYTWQVGLSDTTTIPAANSIAWIYSTAVDATHIMHALCSGSSCTNTAGPTETAGTDNHLVYHKDPGDSTIYAFDDGTQVSIPGTNVPTTNGMQLLSVVRKSAGTVARTLDHDWISFAWFNPPGRAQ